MSVRRDRQGIPVLSLLLFPGTISPGEGPPFKAGKVNRHLLMALSHVHALCYLGLSVGEDTHVG